MAGISFLFGQPSATMEGLTYNPYTGDAFDSFTRGLQNLLSGVELARQARTNRALIDRILGNYLVQGRPKTSLGTPYEINPPRKGLLGKILGIFDVNRPPVAPTELETQLASAILRGRGTQQGGRVLKVVGRSLVSYDPTTGEANVLYNAPTGKEIIVDKDVTGEIRRILQVDPITGGVKVIRDFTQPEEETQPEEGKDLITQPIKGSKVYNASAVANQRIGQKIRETAVRILESYGLPTTEANIMNVIRQLNEKGLLKKIIKGEQ